MELLEGIDLAGLLITSFVELNIADTSDMQIAVRRAEGGKCARCWKIFSEIPADREDAICGRCQTVLSAQMKD